MFVETSRFGKIEIQKEDVIFFPEGILGFDELHDFILVDDPSEEIFAWLQSCESEKIAFPVLEPELFTESYKVDLSRRELDALELKTIGEARLFSIITIPQDPRLMTANLKAPLILNPRKRIGRQCVLQDHSLNIREPIFSRLQQRVVANPASPIRSQALDQGVAVSLPAKSPDAEL